jgi:predicted nucleotidyltransferase
MSAAFGRDALLDAFDQIGRAAVLAGTKLQIVVYGGSALMLASNFRFATEDVDIAEIGGQWPVWLSDAVERIANENNWSTTWLNDAVTFHLSSLSQADRDLTAFGTFPRLGENVGLCVFVPTARYMLALKLKALRISDFEKGQQDMADVAHLLKALNLSETEQAIAIFAEFFPNSAADADKQRFVLKRLFSGGTSIDAPRYPRKDS